jgi:hypothetical protein
LTIDRKPATSTKVTSLKSSSTAVLGTVERGHPSDHLSFSSNAEFADQGEGHRFALTLVIVLLD